MSDGLRAWDERTEAIAALRLMGFAGTSATNAISGSREAPPEATSR